MKWSRRKKNERTNGLMKKTKDERDERLRKRSIRPGKRNRIDVDVKQKETE